MAHINPPAAINDHKELHVHTSPLYDPGNFPGTTEDLTVKIPVSVMMTDASDHVIPATMYANFPVQLPALLSAPQSRPERIAPVVKKFPSLPELTSATHNKQHSSLRAQTPVPKFTALLDGPGGHPSEDAVLRRPRSAIGHRHFTISRTPPPESLKAYAGHPEDAGKQPETQPVTLPAYIDDPVTKSQIRVPAHLEIGARPDSLNTAAAQGLPYNVSYKIVARSTMRLPSRQEVYDTALQLRTPELDALRNELGIDLGNMPALPPRSDPRQRAWAKPLIAKFEDIICREMRKIWLAERCLALRTMANVGVDIVPVVQSPTHAEVQPGMQLTLQPASLPTEARASHAEVHADATLSDEESQKNARKPALKKLRFVD